MRTRPFTYTIYFIRDLTSGLIKIGVTTGDPFSRYYQIRSYNPNGTALLGFYQGWDHRCERAIHRRFDRWRVFREWFAETPQLLALIAEKCAPVVDPARRVKRIYCPACKCRGSLALASYCRRHARNRHLLPVPASAMTVKEKDAA